MNFGRCNKKGTKGIFGVCPKTCYVYIQKLESEFNRKISVLIPDCAYGYTAMTFLRYGHNVNCYEKNGILLNGGNLDSFHTIGFGQKISNENLKNFVYINEDNYYEVKVEKKYDFVYSYRSLHLEQNKHIPLKRKVRKLLSAVKINGYIYTLLYGK